MILIDLSRDIVHRMPGFSTHAPVIITLYGTHDEVRTADGYKFSSATMSLAMGDHAGTTSMRRAISIPAPARRRSMRCRWRHSSPKRCASTCRTSR